MKKLIGLVMTVVMLFVMQGALAEGEQLAPLYATVGEALEDSAEDRVVAGGVPGDYYAVVTRKNGKYYRSVALCDEKLNELNEALENLDYEAEDFFEKHDAATQAVDDYLKTLPIAYSEAFTAAPLTDGEMDIQAFADTLKAKYPDYSDMIDAYITMYQTYGAEGFASMMNPAQ